jgi:transcription initiation factor TFIIIB Brf1 subunit/transcription initiation factor TFIIB
MDNKKIINAHNQIITELQKKNLEITHNKNDPRIKQITLKISQFPLDKKYESLKRESYNWFNDKKLELILSGTRIDSFAAGIIDVISRKNNLEITPKKIAKFYKISENSVRQQSQKIAKELGITLSDKRKKKS